MWHLKFSVGYPSHNNVGGWVVAKFISEINRLSMSRPLVSVYDTDSATVTGTVTLPAVFNAPIRGDVVNYVHNLMSKNSRQAYGVFARAGMGVRRYII